MTNGAGEEIDRYAQPVFNHNGWNTDGEPFKLTEVPLIKLPEGKYVLYSDHLTQVEKARRDEQEECAEIADNSCLENECADWGECHCSPQDIATRIRNKPEKE